MAGVLVRPFGSIAARRHFDVQPTEYSGPDRHGSSTGGPDQTDILRADSPDGHARDPVRGDDERTESIRPDGVARVDLGTGNPPGTDSPIVGALAPGDFVCSADRGSDQKSLRCSAACLRHRQVIRSQVHARCAGGECHIEPVIHQHRDVKHPDQGTGRCHELPSWSTFEPKLYTAHPAANRRLTHRHQITALEKSVIGNQHEAERRR